MKIKAANYKNRQALEQAVRLQVGLTMGKSVTNTVEGTKSELAQFGLSDSNLVHGCEVVCTDFPSEAEPQRPKPERGERKESKIN